MQSQVLSITLNKGGKSYKVTIVEPTGLVIRYFTYWPESGALTAPRLKLGKYYKPVLDMPLPWLQIITAQVVEYLEKHPEKVEKEGQEQGEPVSPPTETPKGRQPIPEAKEPEKSVVWYALAKADGTFVKRHRREDDSWSPIVEITEAEYNLINSADAPMESTTSL